MTYTSSLWPKFITSTVTYKIIWHKGIKILKLLHQTFTLRQKILGILYFFLFIFFSLPLTLISFWPWPSHLIIQWEDVLYLSVRQAVLWSGQVRQNVLHKCHTMVLLYAVKQLVNHSWSKSASWNFIHISSWYILLAMSSARWIQSKAVTSLEKITPGMRLKRTDPNSGNRVIVFTQWK